MERQCTFLQHFVHNLNALSGVQNTKRTIMVVIIISNIIITGYFFPVANPNHLVRGWAINSV